MQFFLISVIFLILHNGCNTDSDKNTENHWVTKGGISSKKKLRMDVSKVFVSPLLRDVIKVNNNEDLLDYTVCEQLSSEMRDDNITTRNYEYTICPDKKTSEGTSNTVETVLDYCCYVNSTLDCCNINQYKIYRTGEEKRIKGILLKLGGVVLGIIIIIFCCSMVKRFSKRFRFRQSGNAMFQPVVAQPMVGQPMMGQPMMGQPMMGQPMMGQPMMGQPMMGQPMVAQPMMAQPLVQPVVMSGPVIMDEEDNRLPPKVPQPPPGSYPTA